MVTRLETNRIETPNSPPETPFTPAQELPKEIQSLIHGLEAHRQVVNELIAGLKEHNNGNQTPEDQKLERRKIVNDTGAKLVRSAYDIQHLVNSLSSR